MKHDAERTKKRIREHTKELVVNAGKGCANLDCRKPNPRAANPMLQYAGAPISIKFECKTCGATWTGLYRMTEINMVDLRDNREWNKKPFTAYRTEINRLCLDKKVGRMPRPSDYHMVQAQRKLISPNELLEDWIRLQEQCD